MEISCVGSDTRSYFETFIQSPKQSELKITPEDNRQFSASPVNKYSPSFRNSLTE